MGKDKTYTSFTSTPAPQPPQLTLAQVSSALHNHQIYLQAAINYIGQQLGWRWYGRVAFLTALTVGAFREEIVGLYFLLRSLVS